MGRDVATQQLEGREDETYMLRLRPAGQPRLKHETNYAISLMLVIYLFTHFIFNI